MEWNRAESGASRCARRRTADRLFGPRPYLPPVCVHAADTPGIDGCGRGRVDLVACRMAGEALDGTDVFAYSLRREVSSLELLQHDFAKTGQGPPCDPPYSFF